MLLYGVYFALIIDQFGRQTKAEWWVRDVIEAKNYIARQTGLTGPVSRTVILGGSNCLFGVDSNVLAAELGDEVVNLSVHANLGISFLLRHLERNIRQGDRVIMSLEHGYFNQARLTDWYTHNMLAWGESYFWRDLSLYEKLLLLASVPKQALADRLQFYRARRAVKTSDEIVAEYIARQDFDSYSWQNRYSHLSLNKRGDLLVEQGPVNKLSAKYWRGIPYFNASIVPSPHFVTYFKKIQNLVQDHNGTLLLTWPVSIQNASYDLRKETHQRATLQFSQNLEQEGIEIVCSPAAFQMPPGLFFNTHYHPNRFGAEIRSRALATCIDRLTAGNESTGTFAENFSETEELIARYVDPDRLEEYGERITRDSNVLANLRDTARALEDYRGKEGRYPLSEEWVSRIREETQSNYWIPGLAPHRDRKEVGSPDWGTKQQVLYKSDGEDFKLIAAQAPDREIVIARFPDNEDPRRKSRAYGFWTTNARNW